MVFLLRKFWLVNCVLKVVNFDFYCYYTIHYFSSRQVIWSHIRCLDFIFPEPEARGIFNPDKVYETILLSWSWNNIFVILQILYKTPFYNGISRVISSFFISFINLFCIIKKITPKNGLFNMNKPKTLQLSRYSTVKMLRWEKHCTGKFCYDVKNNGFSWCHSEVSLTSHTPYIRLQPYMKQ